MAQALPLPDWDQSIAMQEIPAELRCTACGFECIGPPISIGGEERICMRCFRERRYQIVVAENGAGMRYKV